MNWSRASRTTGMTGVWCEVETVFTFGMSLVHLSCPTAVMAGSGSYLMANWQLCTLVEALRVVQILQVLHGPQLAGLKRGLSS